MNPKYKLKKIDGPRAYFYLSKAVCAQDMNVTERRVAQLMKENGIESVSITLNEIAANYVVETNLNGVVIAKTRDATVNELLIAFKRLSQLEDIHGQIKRETQMYMQQIQTTNKLIMESIGQVKMLVNSLSADLRNQTATNKQLDQIKKKTSKKLTEVGEEYEKSYKLSDAFDGS